MIKQERQTLIKQMPDQALLEDFMRGMLGEEDHVRVTFNLETGMFERLPSTQPEAKKDPVVNSKKAV